MSDIFDNWTHVECSDCSHYWNDSCDGVVKGSSKACTAFMATKRVDIPLQIKSITAHLKWLYGVVIFETIVLIGFIVGGLT